MEIGVIISEYGKTFDDILDEARRTAGAGLGSFWLGQHSSWHALTALTLAARDIPGLNIGTAVIPTYPEHPLALASQALTVQAATGNRLTLGIGLSHKFIIEGQYGYSFDHPVRHMRDYLHALNALLAGREIDYTGETLRAAGLIAIPGARAPAVLVAALGPAMLRLAGGFSDGTLAIWAGPRTIAQHLVPILSDAAAAAGRPSPRIAVSVMVGIADSFAAAQDRFRSEYPSAGQAPSYRSMIEREGADGPQDLIAGGPASQVRDRLEELIAAGATDLIASVIGTLDEKEQALTLLAEIASEHTGQN